MADFIITDIVSESAILSVKNLTEELNTSKAAFASYAAEIAQASTGASKSFADLEAKVKAFEAQQKQMAQSQAQYNANMADLKKKLADVEAQLQAATKAQQQQAQANQSAAQANQQQAQSAQTAAQAAEQQRAAAVANIQALEQQRAAMLANFEVSEQNKQSLIDQNGALQDNYNALAEQDRILRDVAAAKAQLNKDEQAGKITTAEAEKERRKLLETEMQAKVAKQEITHAIKSEIKETQAADGSYKQLSQTLAQLKDAYKQMNAEERSGAKGQELLRQIQELDTGLKGTAGSMGEHQREVGNYEQAILGALGVNNRFASSILDMTKTGQGLNGVLAVGATKVKAFGAALWTLVKNPVFLAIAGIGGSIAALKWLYNYNQGIAEATRLTREFTGELDNDVVTTYRNNIQAIADVYGKEFKEVLDGADTLVAQYGKSWGEALDVIDKGFAAGADLNGTFLSQIKQYAPAFRDAGVSMSQLVAMIAQTRSGIFSEQGMNMMQMAFKRLREGTTATKEALAGIGIDVDKLYKDMADGTTSPIEALQMVSEHLNNVGENSEEAGAVLKDVFGRQGANGGMQMVKSLKSMQTELNKVQEQTGEYGKLQRQLKLEQERLNNAMSAFFDLSGKGWENFIMQVKIIVYQYLVKFIEKVAELYNRFVDWYNASQSLRTGLAGIASILIGIFNAQRAVWEAILNGLKAVGNAIHGATTAFDGLWYAIKNPTDAYTGLKRVATGIVEIANAARDAGTGIFKALGDNITRTIQQSLQMINNASGTLNKINPYGGTMPYRAGGGAGGGGGNGNGNGNGGGGSSSRSGSGGGSAATREAEDNARYMQEIEKKLADARIAMIPQTYEREVAEIKAGWQEKLDEIKGNSAQEVELRERYTTLMNAELEEKEKEHNAQMLALQIKNQENLVAGLNMDANLQLDYWEERKKLLEMQHEQERAEAEKNGEDMQTLAIKHNREMEALENEQGEHLLQQRLGGQAKLATQRKMLYEQEMNDLLNHYIDGKLTQQQYEEEKIKLSEKYAQEEAQTQVNNLKRILDSEYLMQLLSGEKIEELREQLAQAEVALQQKKTEQIEAINKRADEAQQKRLEKQVEYLQTAQKFITEFANLGNAIFDNEAQKLEEAQDKLDEAYEREGERIEKLQEQGTISTEEAERRKEQAEKRHAKEKEKLEKKQAELKRRQAIFDKANNASQTIMNTAVAIMNAWATGKTLADKIAQTAIISALGAVQLATILAQPIPKYAKGTDSHKGGLAIVGDAGKRELVITAGNAWITPNTPTLVDMPKGAMVHPNADLLLAQADIRKADAVLRMAENGIAPVVNVENDYTRLERATYENTNQIKTLQKIVARGYTDAEYLRQYGRI